MPRNGTPLRSIGAILAGLVVIFAVTTGIDVAMHAMRVFPPLGEPMGTDLLVLAFLYRLFVDVFGCYVTAALAPAKPMKHALILGGVGTALSAIGAAFMWGYGSHWYPVALTLSSLPSGWLGAKVFQAR